MDSCASACVNKCPIFYGYVVAAFGTMGMIATGPGQTPVIGTTITQVSDELGLGRTFVSSLYLIATVGSACTLPLVGRSLDRLGPPPLFVAASLGLGVTCYSFAKFVDASTTLCVAFYFLRIFGQGTLTLVSQNAINLWFDKRRGKVMGICSFFNSLYLTGLFSSVIKRSVEAHGWRSTYHGLAGVELFVVLPLGAVFLRQKPEVYGLAPDGVTAANPGFDASPQKFGAVAPKGAVIGAAVDEELPLTKPSGTDGLSVSSISTSPASQNEIDLVANASSSASPASEKDVDFAATADVAGTSSRADVWRTQIQLKCDKDVVADSSKAAAVSASLQLSRGEFTLSGALFTTAFWAMSAGCFTIAALGTALFFHLDAIFTSDRFVGKLQRIYLSSATSAALTTLGTGFVIDKFAPQYIMAGSLCAMVMVLLSSAAAIRWHMSAASFFVVGCLQGCSMGSFNTCASVAYAKWFGRSHNGKIQGVANSLVVLGSAVGPAVVSLGHDVLGTFDGTLLICSLWPFLCAVVAACVRAPIHS